MDLVAACRVLVHLDEQGSVTRAAAAAGVPQSVASRRLAALEAHLGVALVDRAGPRAGVGAGAHALMPVARRLVRTADLLEADAEAGRLKPVVVAMPDGCPSRELAVLDATSWAEQQPVEVVQLDLLARIDALAEGTIDAAVLPAPPPSARWRVPLGCASRAPLDRGSLRVASLRPTRAGTDSSLADPIAGRRVNLVPEDDVPHVRDVLERVADRSGVRAGSVRVATSRTAALGAVLGRGELVVLSAEEAGSLGLAWLPFADVVLERGYALSSRPPVDLSVIASRFHHEIAACLGAPT